MMLPTRYQFSGKDIDKTIRLTQKKGGHELAELG